MKRRITKIKHNAGKVKIDYLIERNDEQVDEYSLVCSDAPVPEFAEALQALKKVLPAWLECKPDYCDNMTILGVSISWKGDNFGCCVTALKPLKSCNSPLVLNAPHKPMEPYSGDDYANCLTQEQIDGIKNVIAEAEAYIDGTRAQMGLFDGLESVLKEAGVTATITVNA